MILEPFVKCVPVNAAGRACYRHGYAAGNVVNEFISIDSFELALALLATLSFDLV
jgi:hypothetical protein